MGVSIVIIDANNYEVTNPGLGKMRAIFNESRFIYVYP